MGALFILVGSLGFTVGIFMLIILLIRRKPKKKWGLITGGAFALTVLGAAISPSVEETEKKETETVETAGEVAKTEEPTAEEKAKNEAEAKAKAEEEKKAKEAEKAEESKKKLAKEKEYYINEIKSKVDTQMQMYDDAWSSVWQPTFEGVGNGTVDVYTAYDNMKTVEQRYKTLQSSIPAISDEGLSKENQKLFSEFKSKMRNASMWRAEAAIKAQKMFDKGDFSPSSLDKMKGDVEYADSEMLSAIISLTTLEATLEVERE
ncbi:hypothetical protein [Psychrobacillus lasiicapitis]|uniref:Uncharacterized protein n=1 Tax=Psychrobacillus lasiicapitis TaxID=1636719 RepID=A0A544TAD6_9BACI|nr:hypothetical protein [Psychrobacillus lasiicapitis]TQR14432.1 hypothetical protein FG382_08230 [Psychrobacillus lasiicapitis]GGA31392.1 hypothetical protein GCM10011384_21110 [Psychrobacillus lasiicapitis]